MDGRPPLSMICESSWKVSGFGSLALPKNSTQNAGSNEKDANDELSSIEAPAALSGILSFNGLLDGAVGKP